MRYFKCFIVAATLALACWSISPSMAQSDDANRLTKKVIELHRSGKFAEAIPLAQRALVIWEKQLGPHHRNVATALNNLANLYRDQGRYVDAEQLHKRSLAIREKALGPSHVDVAQSLNNLANLYRDQGRYADAEPLYERSLAIRRKALRPDHPDIAASLNSLASLYRDQGRYADAEPLYKRSLAIYEKALGSDHRDVARPLATIGEEVQHLPICHARDRTPEPARHEQDIEIARAGLEGRSRFDHDAYVGADRRKGLRHENQVRHEQRKHRLRPIQVHQDHVVMDQHPDRRGVPGRLI